MPIETIIGFDSAWTNKVDGAIFWLSHDQGNIVDVSPPALVRFEEAAQIIEAITEVSDYTLIGLDQPTLVPNKEGMRPVERVAASVVNAIKGGVQPANTSKISMFGPSAPIWSFLKRVRATENPSLAKGKKDGTYLFETFPALALPTIVPSIWERRMAAKYNPKNTSFSLDDWRMVSEGLRDYARQHNIPWIADYLHSLARNQTPKKGDQDKLDAMICFVVAWVWRYHQIEQSIVLGDNSSGYMLTPCSSDLRTRLEEAAKKLNVPIDVHWHGDVFRTEPNHSLSQTTLPEDEPKPTSYSPEQKRCPICGHVFKGNGWGGMDAHWRAKHNHLMSYEEAWPKIKSGSF